MPKLPDMKILRVFPERTSHTPTDSMAFIGEPQFEGFRPAADVLHISVTFTWHKPYAEYLKLAWSQYYPIVKIGGPAYDDPCNSFTPGLYIKEGVTFTSRGCNYQCPPCLVWRREGKLKQIENFYPGRIIQDNNLFQCARIHIRKVFDMLKKQSQIEFTGGLDSRSFTPALADELKGLRIKQMFFACDSKSQLKPLQKAGQLLKGYDHKHLRCYVLLAYNGQTISQAKEILEEVWQAGFMPHAQLYQPPSCKKLEYSKEWTDLARSWSRPVIMRKVHNNY